MSVKGLQELSKHGLLCGDDIKELDFYENYIFGKGYKVKFVK